VDVIIKTYVIIGGGPAGANAALELRKNDIDGKIIMVSDENYVFYKRSKIIDLISNSCIEDDLYIKGKDIYEKNRIDLRYAHVLKIEPEKNKIFLDNGTFIGYDMLLIATGGHPILLPWKGVELDGISPLYTLNDAKKVLNQACKAKNAVIIGGGSIAMKVVKNLFKMDLKVSIVEKASHLWPIGFDRKVSRIIEEKLKQKGIQLYLNEEVIGFNGENGKVSSVSLKSHKEIPSDLVIITIGMKPNIDYLKSSGVIIDKGVLVDKYLRTNFQNIYAAGDVAQIEDPLYRAFILHPTWGNAKKQGKVAAKNMIGKKIAYEGTIPIQTIKVLGFQAIAAGITHSKKNFDEISWISFQKGFCRKFVLNNNQLVGVLILGRNINKKELKPLIKNAVSKMVDVNDFKPDLLKENFDFEKLLSVSSINSTN
jgi:NAD(P)H-nitrite reductase large subunit